MRYQAPLNFVLLILKNGRGGAEIEVASKHDDFRPQAGLRCSLSCLSFQFQISRVLDMYPLTLSFLRKMLRHLTPLTSGGSHIHHSAIRSHYCF